MELLKLNSERVAILLPNLQEGGAERVMLNLANCLVERGLGVDLVLQRAEGCFLSQVSDKVTVVDLNAKSMASSGFALVLYLRRRRPRAVLAALTTTNILGTLAKRLAKVDTRIVISEHNTLSIASRNSQSLKGRCAPLLQRVVYRWADGIVAVSDGVADDLAQTIRLPRRRIEVIYNPVVTPELLRKAQETVEHRWLRPGEPPVVLTVGRLTKQKDLPTLLRAFALVRKERAARLLILGEGEERSRLRTLIEDLGITQDVDMPGFVDNPYKYMSHAAVFVLSSRWEGLSSVLIEAMACGTRVISTDCPHGPKLILGDGKYGLLVPVGDIDALATELSRVLAGGSDAPLPPPEAWSSFTPDAIIPKYVEVLLRQKSG